MRTPLIILLSMVGAFVVGVMFGSSADVSGMELHKNGKVYKLEYVRDE